MVTTIQLNNSVKNLLDSMKTTGKETYEEVILEMMKQLEEKKRNDEELMIEGCKEMYSDMLDESKAWESTLMDGLDRSEKWT